MMCRRMRGICKLNASQRPGTGHCLLSIMQRLAHPCTHQASLAAQGKLGWMAPRREPLRNGALTCQSTTNTTSAAMMPVPTASTFKVTILQRQRLTSWSCQSQSTPILLAGLAAVLASV